MATRGQRSRPRSASLSTPRWRPSTGTCFSSVGGLSRGRNRATTVSQLVPPRSPSTLTGRGYCECADQVATCRRVAIGVCSAGVTLLPPGSAAAAVDYTAKFLTEARATTSSPAPTSCAPAPLSSSPRSTSPSCARGRRRCALPHSSPCATSPTRLARRRTLPDGPRPTPRSIAAAFGIGLEPENFNGARRRETVELLCRTSTCSAARSQGGAKLPTGGKCEPARSPRALPSFV